MATTKHIHIAERSNDFESLLDLAAEKEARVALLGEGSHGTHEFYEWRAGATREFIATGRFLAVAIEADGEICKRLNEHIQDTSSTPEDLQKTLVEYTQWPSWTIANDIMLDFCQWLREYNRNQPVENRVNLYGLDRYPLWDALEAFADYTLDELEWSATKVNDALDAPLRGEAMAPPSLIAPIATHLAKTTLRNTHPPHEAITYYRELLEGGDGAMRARTEHWIGEIGLLLNQLEESGVVVWAHNVHVAKTNDGEVLKSFGKRAIEICDGKVVTVLQVDGEGTVAAAPQRGVAMRSTPLPPPQTDSINAQLVDRLGDRQRALYTCAEQSPDDPCFENELGLRAIGMVYEPGNTYYKPTILATDCDAVVVHGSGTRSIQALNTSRLLRRRQI